MKKIIIPILVFVSTSVFSQNKDSTRFRKHEIGFGFTNIFSMFGGLADNGYFFNQDDYGPAGYELFGSGKWGGNGSGYINNNYFNYSPGYGIAYKYHFKGGQAIRAGIDLSTINAVNEGTQRYSYFGGDSINKFNSKSTRFVIKAGYQFEKQIRRIMVFGGIDVFRYSKETDYEMDFTFNANFYEKGSLSAKGIGISPFGGVLFRIGELFSISTEARFHTGSYSNSGSYSGVDLNLGGSYSGDYSGKSFEAKFNPLGVVSFNIHL